MHRVHVCSTNERVEPVADSVLGDVLVWTGGDGSSRLYLPDTSQTDVWCGDSRGVPDTIAIEYPPPDSSEMYVRHLPGGGEVHYTPVGRHARTADRNGNVTVFTDTTVASETRLKRIELPTPAGSDEVIRLHYDGTSGELDSVQVVRGDGGGRLTRPKRLKPAGRSS